MGAMFQIAGGTLSAQDESASAALSAAAAPAPVINGPSTFLPGVSTIASLDAERSAGTNFAWVDGEDASGMSLETIKSGAESLSPAALRSTAERMSSASSTLNEAAGQLLSDVQQHLGTSWTGAFADAALSNVSQFHASATSLASELDTVASRAHGLADGYDTTRTQVASLHNGDGIDDRSERVAKDKAALEDAQRIIHSEYNPRIEEANLSTLTFTPAHRVGSGAASGINAVSPVDLWNGDVPGVRGSGGVGAAAGVDAPAIAATAHSGGSAIPGAISPAGGITSPAPSTDASATSTTTTTATGTASPIAAAAGRTAHETASPTTRTRAPSTTSASTTVPARSPSTSTPTGGTSPRHLASSSAPLSRAAAPSGATGSGARALTSGTKALGGVGSRVPTGSSTVSAVNGTPSHGYRSGIGAGGFGSSVPNGGAPSGGAAGSPASTPGRSGASGYLGGTGSGSMATGRSGSPMMGGMVPGGAAGSGGPRQHTPADYLTHPANSSELLGDIPGAVTPVLRGSRTPDADADPEP